MSQVGWFLAAWVGGSLAILGSLMTLGSLLLWLVPRPVSQTKKVSDHNPATTPGWQTHLKLIVFAGMMTITGLILLYICPLPQR